jgi:hypothetical protein
MNQEGGTGTKGGGGKGTRREWGPKRQGVLDCMYVPCDRTGGCHTPRT